MIENNKSNLLPHYVMKDMNMIVGKKIVLYGAGRVGQDYYDQILKHKDCNIIAWADSNWSKYHYEYATVIDIKKVIQLSFDIIVIAVYDKQIAEEIRDSLVRIGVHKSKIIWTEPEEYFRVFLK